MKTKAQLARILGNKFDLAGFDFRTGRIMSGGVHRRTCLAFFVTSNFVDNMSECHNAFSVT